MVGYAAAPLTHPTNTINSRMIQPAAIRHMGPSSPALVPKGEGRLNPSPFNSRMIRAHCNPTQGSLIPGPSPEGRREFEPLSLRGERSEGGEAGWGEGNPLQRINGTRHWQKSRERPERFIPVRARAIF